MNTIAIKEEKRNKKILLVSMSFLLSILFFRDIFHLTFNNIYVTIFIGLICVFLNTKNMANFIGLLFPLSLGGIQIGYVGLTIAILLLLRLHLRIKPALFFLVYIGIEVIHYINYPASIHVEKSINTVVTYLSLVLISICLLTQKRNKIDIVEFVKFFCYGAGFLCTMSVLNCINIFGIASVFSGMSRLQTSLISEETSYETSLMLIANANALAYFSIVGASCVIALNLKKKVSNQWALIMLGLLLISGLTYVSRTWMILTVLNLLLVMGSGFRSNKTLVLSVCFILLIVFVGGAFGHFLDAFQNRFDDPEFVRGGSRAHIFDYYNKYLLDHKDALLFGVGAVFYSDVIGYEHSIHNGLQQVIVAYGLIGGLFVLFFFFAVCFTKIKKIDITLIAPLFTTLFFLQTIQVLMPYSQLLPLVPSALLLELSAQKETR